MQEHRCRCRSEKCLRGERGLFFGHLSFFPVHLHSLMRSLFFDIGKLLAYIGEGWRSFDDEAHLYTRWGLQHVEEPMCGRRFLYDIRFEFFFKDVEV
jgi:hypothetical protein